MLNLVVEPKIAITRILVDLNLAFRYGIAIRIILYASRKVWRIIIWQLNVIQTAKPPNFPAIQYIIIHSHIIFLEQSVILDNIKEASVSNSLLISKYVASLLRKNLGEL